MNPPKRSLEVAFDANPTKRTRDNYSTVTLGTANPLVPARATLSTETQVVRLFVTQKDAGIIIGKQGDSIRKLCEVAKVTILGEGMGDRICIITGGLLDIGAVVFSISQRLVTSYAPRNVEPQNPLTMSSTLKLLFPNKHMGRLIGKAGVELKKLERDSGAKIYTQGDMLPNSTERVIQIVGDSESHQIIVYNIALLLSEMSDATDDLVLFDPSSPQFLPPPEMMGYHQASMPMMPMISPYMMNPYANNNMQMYAPQQYYPNTAVLQSSIQSQKNSSLPNSTLPYPSTDFSFAPPPPPGFMPSFQAGATPSIGSPLNTLSGSAAQPPLPKGSSGGPEHSYTQGNDSNIQGSDNMASQQGYGQMQNYQGYGQMGSYNPQQLLAMYNAQNVAPPNASNQTAKPSGVYMAAPTSQPTMQNQRPYTPPVFRGAPQVHPSTGQTTMKMEIPTPMVGFVIGKRGAKIQEIRAMTGCHINVDDEDLPNVEGIRGVVLKGSFEACEYAKSVISDRIREETAHRESGVPRIPTQQNMGYSNQMPTGPMMYGMPGQVQPMMHYGYQQQNQNYQHQPQQNSGRRSQPPNARPYIPKNPQQVKPSRDDEPEIGEIRSPHESDCDEKETDLLTVSDGLESASLEHNGDASHENDDSNV